MIARRSVFSLLAVFLAAAGLRAQSTVPTASQSLPAQALAAGGAGVTLDLRNYFSVPGVTGQVAQFDTVLGKFNIELLANDAPATVANFLNYVSRGAYTNTFIHRSVPGFVEQGGGFVLSGTSINAIAADAPVRNEFKLGNVRGTLAMAKLGTGPDTATCQWFVNLADNRANLDNQNGGFTVFARVLGTGMSVVDAMAALPFYNASTQLGADFGSLPLRAPSLSADNLVLIRSITPMPVFPAAADGAALVGFTVANSNPAAATATLSGSTLALGAVAQGSTVVTVRGVDANGNAAELAFAITVSPGPVFTTQPESRTVGVGESVTLTAAASGASSYQWQRNGVDLAGATNASLTLTGVQPADVGVYVVRATDAAGTRTSEAAIVGLSSTEKIVGAGSEVGSNIVHSNGNIYDQILLTGPAATIRADVGEIVRISYLDATDDIVQVEFSGAGALTLSLENPSGPATPVKYNQSVSYMKGRATIVVAGADASTNLSVFSVGRMTAVNQALFRNDVAYDGMADIALIALQSPGGAFAGLRTANAKYSAAAGLTGVYAPRVAFGGPLFVGNVAASGSATPALVAGSAGDVRITGGDLAQANNAAVRVDGMTKVQMAAGSDSHGNLQPAQPLRGRLERSGVDVTAQLAN